MSSPRQDEFRCFCMNNETGTVYKKLEKVIELLIWHTLPIYLKTERGRSGAFYGPRVHAFVRHPFSVQLVSLIQALVLALLLHLQAGLLLLVQSRK